jgi:hypothetical protein
MTLCKPGELCTPAALSRKWRAQRTRVRFRHHFHDALHATKLLGEKYGFNPNQSKLQIIEIAITITRIEKPS